MTDVLEIAVSQRDELKGEIARLDRFISTARKLMSQAGAAQDDEPASAGGSEDADEQPKPLEQRDGDSGGARTTTLFRR